MSIERFDAVEKLQTIRQQLDDLTRSIGSGSMLGEWVPAMDVLEEENHFRIVLDVPGVNNDDLELSEEGNSVTIAGIRYNMRGNYSKKERIAGQFRRTVELPSEIEASSAQASLKSGVLEVLIAKKKQKALPKAKKTKK